MRNIIIGIDPDVDKSGYAALWPDGRMVAECLAFPDLIFRLATDSDRNDSLLVVVEASWTTGHNWHLPRLCSLPAAARRGYDVGRNHQVGRLIVEMCRVWDINVKEQPPLKKLWNGPDGKITQKEVEAFMPNFPRKSNQEMRDAALLAWVEAGLPIRLSSQSGG